MTTSAIIMMIVAMLLIWGGLVLAIINLSKRGDFVQEGAPASGETRREAEG